MNLSFHLPAQGDDASIHERYPHGYWYASTDDGDFDADGPDPLSAVSALVLAMEEAR